jgi:hypothetical protein
VHAFEEIAGQAFLVGVRDFLAPGRWRNIQVVAGGDVCVRSPMERPANRSSRPVLESAGAATAWRRPMAA